MLKLVIKVICALKEYKLVIGYNRCIKEHNL